jgi:tetratricopeptide repeat protein 8
MQSDGAQFLMADKLNAKQIVKKPHIAKAIVDYLIYVECNYRRALDIAAEGSVQANYKDWWWKARIGKCQFKMGMIKDAEKQFISSLQHNSMIATHIELCKVAIRQDQPLKAIEHFKHG